MTEHTDILVVGAGITGLTLAYALQRADKEVVVLDAGDRPGGKIHTVDASGYRPDAGPNSLMLKGEFLPRLIAELGLSPVDANPVARRRYILNRRHQPVALGPGALLTGRLLSLAARWRLLGEPFRPQRPNDQESIAQFVRRRLGPEVLDWMVDPFVSGVFAGDPERLSIAAALPRLAAMETTHGSLLRAAFAGRGAQRSSPRSRLISFAGGMADLPLALAHALGPRLRTQTPVQAIRPLSNGDWQIQTGHGDSWVSRRLVLAMPSHEIAAILPPEQAALKAQLQGIAYPAVATVALGFPRKLIDHPLDGFGLLIPRRLQIPTLGVLFSSTLFPGRAPDGQVLLTAFLGGAQQNLPAGDDQVIEQVLSDLRPILGIRAPAPDWQRVQVWTQAIPQYQIGHQERLAQIESLLHGLPSLQLLGNWRGGVAVGDCISAGWTAAEALIGAPMS